MTVPRFPVIVPLFPIHATRFSRHILAFPTHVSVCSIVLSAFSMCPLLFPPSFHRGDTPDPSCG